LTIDSGTKLRAQLWGEEYERNISDLVTIKQSIAPEVTEKLRLRLSGAEQQKLVRHDTTNSEAYQFYLRGRYFLNHRTGDNIKRAAAQFQQAIDRDPNFALGYTGLADSYGLREEYAGVPAAETLSLEKDVDRGSGLRLVFLKWWFTFDELGKDPRYAEIRHRIGLEP
jgi:hypothetical protein